MSRPIRPDDVGAAEDGDPRRKRGGGQPSRQAGGSGATQLKQTPKPQAMWFSSETSQGISYRPARRVSAASIPGGAAADDPAGPIAPLQGDARGDRSRNRGDRPSHRRSRARRQGRPRGSRRSRRRGSRCGRRRANWPRWRIRDLRRVRRNSRGRATIAPVPGRASARSRPRRRRPNPEDRAQDRTRYPAVPRPGRRSPALRPARAAVPRPTTR